MSSPQNVPRALLAVQKLHEATLTMLAVADLRRDLLKTQRSAQDSLHNSYITDPLPGSRLKRIKRIRKKMSEHSDPVGLVGFLCSVSVF